MLLKWWGWVMACHGRRIPIHQRYLANKAIRPQKKKILFKSPCCVLGGKKREELIRRKALGSLWSSLVFKEKKLFPLPLSWLCLLHELQPGNIFHIHVILRLRIFLKEMVVAIGWFKKLLRNFLTYYRFYKPSYRGDYHSSSMLFSILSAQNVQGAIQLLNTSSLPLFEIRIRFCISHLGGLHGPAFRHPCFL